MADKKKKPSPFVIYAHCIQLQDPFKTYKEAAEYALVNRGARDKQPTKNKNTQANVKKFIDEMDEWIHPLYMDTSIGGNEVLNPYPGGNPDDDIIYPANSIDGDKCQRGLGRVYKECIQDTQKVLWLTFGIPYFNDLSKFYGLNATSDDSTTYAKFVNEGSDDDEGGILTSALSSMGSFIGGAGKLAISIPFMPYRGMKLFGDTAINDEVTKYYDFKPAMVQYYKLVNSLIGELAVGMGLYENGVSSMIPGAGGGTSLQEGHMSSFDSTYGQAVKELTGNADTTTNYVEQSRAAGGGDYDKLPEVLLNGPDIFTILDKRRRRHAGYENVRSMDGAAGLLATVFNFKESLADFAQGADEYIGFRIEKSTDASESISNTTGESTIAGMLNNISEQTRSKLFDLGSIGNSMVDGLGAIKDTIVSNISEILGEGNKLTQTANASTLFTGNGYFDIPEVWKNSSFTKTYTITMELDARLVDPVSIYQNLYIPYACLMAAATPRAVGHNMYASPFILQAYVQGLFASPLAMIENITVRRGGSDYGWTHDHLPTTINISINIKDLSPAMFLSLYGEGFMSLFANNSSMHEYIATLSGLGVADRKRLGARLKRRMSAAALLHKTTTFNPSYWALRWGKQKLIRTVGIIAGDVKWPN